MDKLLGKKIVGIRYMREDELKAVGWDENDDVTAIILEGNYILYPSNKNEESPGILKGYCQRADFIVGP